MIAPKLLAYMINIPAYCSQEIRVSPLLLSDSLVNSTDLFSLSSGEGTLSLSLRVARDSRVECDLEAKLGWRCRGEMLGKKGLREEKTGG